MTEIQRDLLALLSNVLFGASSSAVLTPEILEEARTQTVSTLISSKEYEILASNIRVVYAHARLTELLRDLPFTTFKGYASASHYPQPTNRQMGDVDIFTDEAHNTIVTKRLINDGYKPANKSHGRHIVFHKNGITLELHNEIKGIPNGQDGIRTKAVDAESIIRLLMDNLIETAVRVDSQHGTIVVPDDLHHGVIMLLHIAAHMLNDGGVGLRHLCDWAVYVNDVDLPQYQEIYKSVGLWTFACQLTAVSTLYLGLPKRPWAGEWPESLMNELINEILTAGNFGHKEAGRIGLAAMKRTSFAEMTKKHYPHARNRMLLPFYMAAYVIRYGWLVILGKRRAINPSVFTGEKKRRQLFEKFELFET